MLIAFVWTHFWELKKFLGLARHFQSIGWHFGKNFLGGAAVQCERQSQGAQKSLRWNSGSGRAARFVVYHKSIFTAVVDELARMTVSLSCSKNCKDGFEKVIVNMWVLQCDWFPDDLPEGFPLAPDRRRTPRSHPRGKLRILWFDGELHSLERLSNVQTVKRLSL